MTGLAALFACAVVFAVLAAAVAGAYLADIAATLVVRAVLWATAKPDDLADVLHVRSLALPTDPGITDYPVTR